MSSDSRLKLFAKEWGSPLIWAAVLWMVIHLFIFQSFSIPSASMRSTLLEGDYIVVNKLAYGARLPITPLSVPFMHQKGYLTWIQLPYWRIPGLSEIKHHDVVVFNYPMEDEFPIDHRTHYIKRCIALPGDTLEIDSAQVYINNKPDPQPEGMQYLYSVITDTIGIDSAFIAKMGIEWAPFTPMHAHYYLFMTPVIADTLKNMKHISSVTLNVMNKDAFDASIFPHDPNLKWNMDYYGPLVIPKKGDSIKISLSNIKTYKRIIQNYEHNELKIGIDSVFINGKCDPYYTFKMNYYFMMGDNRHHSEDSRFWGFVPEDHIFGRASFILFSFNKEPVAQRKARWCTWIK